MLYSSSMEGKAHTRLTHLSGLQEHLITNNDNYYRSTINNLPSEILGEVFVRCLPSSYPALQFPYVFNAPILLCRICKHWREIALSMPILWATFSALPEVAFRSYQKMMKLWLDRSAAFPLTLEVRPWCDIALTDVSPIFLPELHRWRDVTLQLCKDTAELFSEASHSGAPHLERLYLNVNHCTNEQIVRLPTTINKFTSLCNLTLYSYRKIPVPDLVWSHLKTVNIHCPIAVDECLMILGQCSSIVNCSLISLLPPNVAIPSTRITLPTLTTLNLRSRHMDIGSILAHLTCPLLSDLHIDHRLSQGALNVDAFWGFLTPSSPPLKKLEIIDPHSTEEGIVNYLRSPGLRYLTSLKLINNHLGDKLLGALACPTASDPNPTMPLLETVSLDLCNSTDSILGTMITSRFRGTPLKKLNVNFIAQGPYFGGPDGPSKTMAMRQKHFELSHKRDLEIFEGLLRDGMQITWTC